MLEKFRQRSYELENIDKGTCTPEEYEGCLVELRRVNEWLGDVSALRDSLLKEIARAELKSFSVLDVGAGSGELLRVAANPEISSVQADGFAIPFSHDAFDYVIQSLTLHHFDDEGAVRILREMDRVAKRGLFVIDLHRNAIAYFLYTTVGHLVLHNRLLREDGALSILRSFKPAELEEIGRKAGLERVKVEKHFPSRLVLSATGT